jgi:dienelactone hydrolase
MRVLAVLLLLMGVAAGAALGVAHAEPVVLPGPEGVELRAELLRPEGTARAPAIVALHGCGGPYPQRDKAWGEMLRGRGHIVLFPDSFGSRGLGSQCREARRAVTAVGLRRRDALAAAQWLVEQPGTPAGGVVLMGWSDGGSTVLAAGRDHPTRHGLVRGLVAFYPGCRSAARLGGWQPVGPMLILHGEADDWTPIAPCRMLAEEVGAAVTLVAYPGAWHNFDVDIPVRVLRDIPGSMRGDGTVHTGGDAAARADAISRVAGFLDALAAR